MGYERDSDRLVRGVGAIAARDAGNRRRHQLRQAQAVATRRRDRALSGITFGPRGGMRGPLDLGLGYTPTISDEGRGSGKNTTGVSATFVGATGNTKLYGGSGGTPTTTLAQPSVGKAVTFVGQPGSGTLMTFPGGTIPATIGGGTTLTIDPAPGTTGVGVTAGGGATGGGGAGITLEPPPGTVPTIPPITLDPPPDGSVDNTTRNLVIVGGIALAAWLYFRNRGGS